MKQKPPAALALTVITAVAGLLLGVTYMLTKPIIDRQAADAADSERYAVYPAAEGFREVALTDGAAPDVLYEAILDGNTAGYVGRITVPGYGGPIEVTAGLDGAGVITGISVGGADFSESAGLGALTREPAFTGQFAGISAPVALNEDVDAVTGATISSGAVVSAVNQIAKYVQNLGGGAENAYLALLPEGAEELPKDETVERAYRTDAGYVVYAASEGYHGEVHVGVATDTGGVITAVAVDENDFHETAGLGERVLEEAFLSQFVGKSGVIGIRADAASSATAENWDIDSADLEVDGVSGATYSSTAVARAVNAALAYARGRIAADRPDT